MGKYLMVLLFLVVLAGCGKSNQHSNYFTIQLGNNSYTFDSITAQVDTSRGTYLATIFAKNTETGSNIRIDLQSNTPTLKGVYSHLVPTPTTAILINFGIAVFSAANVYTYGIQGTSFTVTVDQANNNSMHGSFSGSLSAFNTTPDSLGAKGQFETSFVYQTL